MPRSSDPKSPCRLARTLLITRDGVRRFSWKWRRLFSGRSSPIRDWRNLRRYTPGCSGPRDGQPMRTILLRDFPALQSDVAASPWQAAVQFELHAPGVDPAAVFQEHLAFCWRFTAKKPCPRSAASAARGTAENPLSVSFPAFPACTLASHFLCIRFSARSTAADLRCSVMQPSRERIWLRSGIASWRITGSTSHGRADDQAAELHPRGWHRLPDRPRRPITRLSHPGRGAQARARADHLAWIPRDDRLKLHGFPDHRSASGN